MLRGLIFLWYGSIANIPSGFALCNGANGTPDLRDKFVVGSGSTYAVNATGGSVNHNHTFTGDGHTHNFGAGTDIGGGVNFAIFTDSANATGTTDNGSSLPPYHSLAYIMKT